jgi:SAM-dependent MidA family methyltransferase
MGQADAGRSGSTSLAERLRGRIDESGPITFAEFMDAALYDPIGGFYSRPPVGEAGHFVTGPHVSPVFGILLARQVEEFWELLERPDPFIVIEVGAGDGTLASQILESVSAPSRSATRYLAVERAEAARGVLDTAGIDSLSGLSQVASGQVGCVLANELIDNLPFHRIRRATDGLVELYVATQDRAFVLVEGPLSSPDLAQLTPDIPPGTEWVIRPGAAAFVDEASRVLDRGYIWTADYALGDPSQAISVHGYRDHSLDPDVLADPGSKDITTGVDFEELRRHALASGLAVWGPVSQREALLALGFRDLDRRAQARQQEAIAARNGIDAMRIYSNRTRANLLVARGGLGDFKVLCIGVGTEAPPRSVRASVW